MEVEHGLERAQIDVVEPELDVIRVTEGLISLERLVLDVNFIENSLLMLLSAQAFWSADPQLAITVDFLNSFIKYQIGITASLKHPCLVVVLIIIFKFKVIIISPLLSSKALLLQVGDIELFDHSVIEFKPFSIVG